MEGTGAGEPGARGLQRRHSQRAHVRTSRRDVSTSVMLRMLERKIAGCWSLRERLKIAEC